MKQYFFAATTLLLAACASTAPVPEPGFEVIDYDRHSEFQAASSADWGAYTKVILETAAVEFRDDWVEDQFRRNDLTIREKGQERIKTGTADLFNARPHIITAFPGYSQNEMDSDLQPLSLMNSRNSLEKIPATMISIQKKQGFLVN